MVFGQLWQRLQPRLHITMVLICEIALSCPLYPLLVAFGLHTQLRYLVLRIITVAKTIHPFTSIHQSIRNGRSSEMLRVNLSMAGLPEISGERGREVSHSSSRGQVACVF